MFISSTYILGSVDRIKIILFLVLAASLAAGFIIINNRENNPAQQRTESVNPSSRPATQQADFDKDKYSLKDPSSIWVIVNKKNPLTPNEYKAEDLMFPEVSQRVPGDEIMMMRREAGEAAEKMFAAARADGLSPQISSAYRSYAFQKNIYNDYVSQQGQSVADAQSARPGYSEHQTGLSVDIQPANGECRLEKCFGDLPEGRWLKNNAHKYGFILRYPPDKQEVTGYIYEPWHYRYVGNELAAEIHKQSGITLEEFFGLEPAGTY